MERIHEQIEQVASRLSRSERRVVAHLLERPEDFAFMSVRQVAQQVGVSTATVTRAAQALGHSGFAGIQAEARRTVWSGRLSERFSTARGEGGQSLADSMRGDLEAVQATIDRIDPEAAERAVDLLSGARVVYVLGQRLSAGPAAFFGLVFGVLLGNVQIVGRHPGMLLDALLEMTPEDLLLVAVFPHYTPSSLQMARMAKEQGVSVIALTDGPLSPVVPWSDAAFYVGKMTAGPADTYVAAVSLLNGLVAQVAARKGSLVEDRLERLDRILGEAARLEIE